jgi:hypothetical protein
MGSNDGIRTMKAYRLVLKIHSSFVIATTEALKEVETYK